MVRTPPRGSSIQRSLCVSSLSCEFAARDPTTRAGVAGDAGVVPHPPIVTPACPLVHPRRSHRHQRHLGLLERAEPVLVLAGLHHRLLELRREWVTAPWLGSLPRRIHRPDAPSPVPDRQRPLGPGITAGYVPVQPLAGPWVGPCVRPLRHGRREPNPGASGRRVRHDKVCKAGRSGQSGAQATDVRNRLEAGNGCVRSAAGDGDARRRV